MISDRPRILLIANDANLPGLIRPILEAPGYDVSVATDSRVAVRLFLRTPYRFDVIVVDEKMPRVLGVPLADGILRVRPDMPVILYSDVAPSPEPKASGGRVAVVSKRSGPDTLISAISQFLPDPRL